MRYNMNFVECSAKNGENISKDISANVVDTIF